jgi:hypothetical protein
LTIKERVHFLGPSVYIRVVKTDSGR